MTKYLIHYSFDGNGTVTVEAKDKKEAEQKYDDGDWLKDEETGDNYMIQLIAKA